MGAPGSGRIAGGRRTGPGRRSGDRGVNDDTAGDADRPACGLGAVESRDRTTALPVTAHDRLAPLPNLPEVGHQLARSARVPHDRPLTGSPTRQRETAAESRGVPDLVPSRMSPIAVG